MKNLRKSQTLHQKDGYMTTKYYIYIIYNIDVCIIYNHITYYISIISY
jgi:hypothetical protein